MIEITDLQRVTVKEDDVLVLRVDLKALPPARRKEFADAVKTGLKSVFPNNKCIILDKDKDMELIVVGKDELE